MRVVFLSLFFLISLGGCEYLKPVTAEEVAARSGQFIQRTDVGGYYRYDDGRVEAVLPPWGYK